MNKYTYLHVLQGNYGYGDGFEDLTVSTDRREVKQNLKDYRDNEGGTYRIIQRRELNPSYVLQTDYEHSTTHPANKED